MTPAVSALFDRFLPLHLRISGAGVITHAGPTLARLRPKTLVGTDLAAVFDIRWPASATPPATLSEIHGRPVRLRFREPPHTVLRGLALRSDCEDDDPGAMVMTLSFGIALPEAVAQYGLTAGDFAATDLAVEMLFLAEAQAAAIGEWRKLTHRLEAARSSAEARAETDVLTGLANRRGLNRAAGHLLGGQIPFALLAIDLDHLKRVNDNGGHEAGDQALRAVGQALLLETRDKDTVARIGGDEFVILLNGIGDPAAALSIARRIATAISRTGTGDTREDGLSASAGVAVSTAYTAPGLETMLRDADAALYRSKAEGRNRITLADPSEAGATPQEP